MSFPALVMKVKFMPLLSCHTPLPELSWNFILVLIYKNSLRKIIRPMSIHLKEVALATGICPRSISNIESGEYPPSLETALRMAQYFNVPVEAIFSLTEE